MKNNQKELKIPPLKYLSVKPDKREEFIILEMKKAGFDLTRRYNCKYDIKTYNYIITQ